MKKALRLTLVMCLALLLSAGLVACNGDNEEEYTNGQEVEPPVVQEAPEDPAGTWEGEMTKVKIEFEDFGDVIVELNHEAAPQTVDNFLRLVNDGFYDGLGFHRIIEGFMIQGGDPTGTGMGDGSTENIVGEFSANGIENNIHHRRGVISMARSMDFDSASSQFFIMHQDGFFLDGEYAGFGRVVEGMDVVDAIAENTPVTDGNGSVSPENHPKMLRVSVVD